jgi:hypothetical protein
VKIDHEIMVRLLAEFRSEAPTDRRLGLFYLKSIVKRIMVGFELDIIILKNNDMVDK